MSEYRENASAIIKRLGLRSAARPGAWSGDQLEQEQNSPDGTLRAQAIQELSNRDIASENSMMAMRDQHPLVWTAALQALGRGADPLPLAPLLVALQDSEWSVRALAALLLRRAGTSIPLEPLL